MAMIAIIMIKRTKSEGGATGPLLARNDIYELGPFFHLFGEHFTHQYTGLDDLRVCYAIVDVDAVPPRFQYALVSHDRKMLGHVGLRNAKDIHEFSHGLFAVFQGVYYLEPLRTCQGLADLGLKLE